MIIFVSILVAFILTVVLFMQQSKFGKTPREKRLAEVQNSKHYKNGKFENIEHTPDLTEGVSYTQVMREFFFSKNPNRIPPRPLPSQKINLLTLSPTQNTLVWFGHSSYFMQIDGKKILVDPVFSGAASPVSFTTKSFKGSDVYSAGDFPEIDYLFLTHDHWDHLDHDTILKLKPKVKKIITSLGVGQHLEHWGIATDKIIEKDWHQNIVLEEGFTVHTIPARHFSGRGFKRAQSIWSSFVFKTPSKKIFIGGDSGYGKHFKETGEKHGPFDLAILECGQYNVNWKYIHMMPEETLKAAEELGAKNLLPVHWAKFSLAMHDWNEPIKRIMKAAEKYQPNILTPMIGQPLNLNTPEIFGKWWETI